MARYCGPFLLFSLSLYAYGVPVHCSHVYDEGGIVNYVVRVFFSHFVSLYA